MGERRNLHLSGSSSHVASAEMSVDELVRLAMTEGDVVARLVGGVARLQQVQHAKSLLAQIEDPSELRRLLSHETREGDL